jgi:hypothetical protein
MEHTDKATKWVYFTLQGARVSMKKAKRFPTVTLAHAHYLWVKNWLEEKDIITLQIIAK